MQPIHYYEDNGFVKKMKYSITKEKMTLNIYPTLIMTKTGNIYKLY